MKPPWQKCPNLLDSWQFIRETLVAIASDVLPHHLRHDVDFLLCSMACRVFRVRSTDMIRYACGKLSLSLKPFGSSVCNFFIQKSSRANKVCRTCSRVMFWSAISSMIMILKSLKEWFSSRKCWSMEIVPTFFESFRCLFSRLWAFWACTLPIYCLSLHLSHQAKYIASLDLHPVFCRISKRCFLVLSVKNFVWTTC